ncbi:MAG: PQQ-binding-like beta-propeller repeat protein [Candidatus Zixiibacteriota bacterium]
MSSSRVIGRLAAALLAMGLALGLLFLPGDSARADDEIVAGLNEQASVELNEPMFIEDVVGSSPEQVNYDEGGGEGLVTDATIKAEPYKTANGFKGWKVHVPDGRPLATPAVADGMVYVGGGFGTYDFYAFDAGNGNLRWQYHCGDDGPTAAIVHNGRVAFNTESCILYVLDAKKGTKVWSQWLGDPLMAQPAAAGDKIYITYPGGDGHHYLTCRALENGGEVWKQPLIGEVITAPVINGGSVFCSTLEGTVYHFDADDGELKWKDQKLATSAPWVVGDEVYVSKRVEVAGEGGTTEQYEGIAGLGRGSGEIYNADELYAYGKADYLVHDPESEYAEEQYELDASVGFSSAPGEAKLDQAMSNVGVGTVSGVWAYQGSRPIVLDNKSYNAMGDAVRAVDVESGKIIWEKQFKQGEERGGRALTPPSYAGDNLYFGSTDGDVLCVRSGDGKELWRFNVGEPIRFQPAVSDGKVFVGTDYGNIFCVDVKDPSADGWPMWGGNAAHNGWEE